MKIAILGNCESTHVTSLIENLSKSNKIKLIILISASNNKYYYNSKVLYFKLKFKVPFCYLFSIFELKNILKVYNPDILNVHYISGYGTLAKLVNYKCTLFSVWGSDIYIFPSISFFHRNLIKINLSSSTAIASTSISMAERIKKYIDNKKIYITPFGINTILFSPTPKIESNKIKIGTIKSLNYIYGIDILIYTFSLILKSNLFASFNLILEITGSGPEYNNLTKLCNDLNISDKVKFNGFVSNEKIPEILNNLDIFVALSRYESYGVSILEACSCAIPVVVSKAPGPSEIVVDEVTGFVVDINDIDKIYNSITKLILSKSLRERLGINGRNHVLRNYSNEISQQLFLQTYNQTILSK